MINFFKLLWIELFGSKKSKLNGSNLFSFEYKTSDEFLKINNLFNKENEKAIIRLPVQGNSISEFLKISKLANEKNINVIALLDSYENDNSMINRLTNIKKNAPYIYYFQIFNELPHITTYPGDQINSLQELIEKTNRYSDWIHNNIKNSQVITMAPYNCMDERSYDSWNGITNIRTLKDLILYTTANIAAIHLYGTSIGKKLQLIELSKNLEDWKKEAEEKGYPKKIWITECGIDDWTKHISFYDKLIKLFKNTIDPEKIIWYRQCTKTKNETDNKFALEILENDQKSPLYEKLLIS